MQLFISHCSKDKPTMRELTAELPGNLGLWLDEDQLAFDQDLSCRLEDVISIESDFVLAFLSRHSRQCKWVEREFAWAREEEKRRGTTFVLPILLEDIRDHPGFSDLILRHHLRITDFSKMGMQSSARKLERMIFTLVMNRLPKPNKTPPIRTLQVSPEYADSPRSNRILIVREGSKSSKRYAVIKCCPDLGLKPTVIDAFSTRDPLPFDAIDSDPLDWQRLLPVVEQRLESSGKFQNVVTFEELEVVNTARLAQYLGCERRLSVSAAKRCRD